MKGIYLKGYRDFRRKYFRKHKKLFSEVGLRGPGNLHNLIG